MKPQRRCDASNCGRWIPDAVPFKVGVTQCGVKISDIFNCKAEFLINSVVRTFRTTSYDLRLSDDKEADVRLTDPFRLGPQRDPFLASLSKRSKEIPKLFWLKPAYSKLLPRGAPGSWASPA